MNFLPKVPVDVIVVDDHPFFREGITTWISRQKELRFCGAADSTESAYALIISAKPHLMLLDLQLPDGDGLELLRRIKDLKAKPRVIVLSHKDQTIFAERALNAGAAGYVLKDEASDTMLTAIHSVLGGGIHLSPEMNRRLFKSRDVTTQAPADKMRALYNRELQVLEYLGRGRTTKEIALLFGLSAKTVESYRESLKRKLEVPDGVTLVRLATIWQQEGHWGLPVPEIPTPRSAGSALRPIVVVDDDDDDLTALRRTLMKGGLSNPLIAFQDSEEVSKYLVGSLNPANPESLPVVVFTDLRMPNMTGIELVAWARADRRFDPVRFVVLSSSREAADQEACKAAGADDYLVKFPQPDVFSQLVSVANAEPRRWKKSS